jgi:hypothetical protein
MAHDILGEKMCSSLGLYEKHLFSFIHTKYDRNSGRSQGLTHDSTLQY